MLALGASCALGHARVQWPRLDTAVLFLLTPSPPYISCPCPCACRQHLLLLFESLVAPSSLSAERGSEPTAAARAAHANRVALLEARGVPLIVDVLAGGPSKLEHTLASCMCCCAAVRAFRCCACAYGHLQLLLQANVPACSPGRSNGGAQSAAA